MLFSPFFFLFLPAALALDPRWGHSIAISDYTLIISSGKSSVDSGLTYTSSPTLDTYLVLPLSTAFDLASSANLSVSSSPSLNISLTGTAPEEAWGLLEVLSTGDLLAFGGQAGTDAALVDGTDSAWLMTNTTAGFVQQQEEWGDEPARRMGAASCTLGETTYLTAGFKPDGSDLPTSTTYSFSSTTSIFTLLSSASLPVDLVQPSLHCLANGTLLLLGGYAISASALTPLSTAYTLDTTLASPEWQTISLGGTDGVPPGRRAHLGVTTGSRRVVFVHGGGTGLDGLESVLDDAWVLDVDQGSWTAVSPQGSGPGARLDHKGVAVGESQVMFFGGYQTTSAADAKIYLYDLAYNSYLSTFTPPSTWGIDSSTTSTPAQSQVIATQTSTYTYPTTLLLPVTTVRSTSVVTSGGSTYTEVGVLTSSALTTIECTGTETLFDISLTTGQTSTLTIDQPSSLSTTTPTTATPTTSFDAATYTGVIPGYATLSSRSSTAHSTSSSTSTVDEPSAGGGLTPKAKLAIGLGCTLLVLALVGSASTYALLVRRNGPGGPGGGGSYADLESDEKDARLLGLGGFGFLLFRRGEKMESTVGSAWSERERAPAVRLILRRENQGRVGMLEEEDSRRFDTWPPLASKVDRLDGDDAEGLETRDEGRWTGLNIWKAGSREPEDGDLGEYHSLGNEDDPVDPFADPDPRSPSSSSFAPYGTGSTDLARSPGMSTLYPGFIEAPSTGISSFDLDSSIDHASSSPSFTPHTPSVEHASSLAYVHHQRPPLKIHRSTSLAGWRKVLGLRARPSLTVDEEGGYAPSSIISRRFEGFRDPATPPTLDFGETDQGGSGKRRVGQEQRHPVQEASLNSLNSARTATTEQIEQYAQLNIVQRNRTSSGSTLSSFPNESPGLDSVETFSMASSVQKEVLRDPFADVDTGDLIAFSPPLNLDHSSRPVIPQHRRSVRETVAAFEDGRKAVGGPRPKRAKVGHVSMVPRPTLTIANPE